MARNAAFCFYCENPLLAGEGHIDHVVPLSRLGPHAELNFVHACPSCNTSKNNMLPSEWPELPERNRERALEREQTVIDWAELDAIGLEPRRSNWLRRMQHKPRSPAPLSPPATPDAHSFG
jgi:hypothetical protein